MFIFTILALHAQRAPESIPSLKKVPVPAPANLSTYVRDQSALVALGKALFWDLQVGSDGKTACASCHFHAGADHRLTNQLSNPNGTLQANSRLTAADFPFHKLADPENQGSRVLRTSTQRAGSAGMFSRKFSGLIPGLSNEDATDVSDKIFQSGGMNLRQVGDRNAPSVLNAVFNFRNFWDGRASEVFNGKTPFGVADKQARILSSANGTLRSETLRIENSSLASQSVGPVLNLAEMSYDSRSWARVGKKMLALRPLANQKIATDDSVLGRFANARTTGFPRGNTYLDLVKSAFQPAYWDSLLAVDEEGNLLSASSTVPEADRFSQAESNFSMFFGLAVQAYEATLVSDDTPVDRFADGQTSALSASEVSGMRLFIGRTGCNACHAGAETTLATHSGVNGSDLLKAGRDTGYFYIGTRPIAEDLGLGGLDGFGNNLATTLPVDNSNGSARGRFKTPGLRNIEFTGPYLHNGSQATLQQVIEFYNRGGDFPANTQNGPNIRPMILNASEQADLVQFLKALTDDRVRFERAPFDHPELCVADGSEAKGGGNPAYPISATDHWVGIPAVGRNGNRVPLQTFDELLAGIGNDGSRAHHAAEPCSIEALTATGFVSANSASFQKNIVAQDSIVSVFGTSFTTSTASAETNPAPKNLAGVSVEVEDSNGTTRTASLFFVSPGQVNFLLPEGTAPGAATIRIAGAPTAFQTPALIRPVAPGIYGASGLAVGNVIAARGGTQAVTPVIRATAAGGLELVPIDLGTEDQQTFVVLYGTGIRNHANPVTARIGGTVVPVAFAGAQGTFEGEDQINIQLPRTLRGAGVVDVILTVDGQNSNAVKIQIQ